MLDPAPLDGQSDRATPEVSSDDLKNYTILSRIGEGTFAHIYRAENLALPYNHELRSIAIKRFKPGYERVGVEEAEILDSLGELDSCVKSWGGYELEEEGSTVIVQELLDWSRSLRLDEKNTYKSFAKIGVQLLSALVQLNSKGYVHCDIKPKNVLYVNNETNTKVKLIDFGNATPINDLSVHKDDFELQSPGYRAPEVLLGDPTFNEKIDVWSVGVILLELLVNFHFKAFRNEWKLILDEHLGTSIICITKVIEPVNVYKKRKTAFWVDGFQSTELMGAKRVDDCSVMIKNLARIMCQNPTSKLALDFVLCLIRVDHNVRWSAVDAMKHPFLFSTLYGTIGELFSLPEARVPGDSQLWDLGLLG